jgi:hypothetical protein
LDGLHAALERQPDRLEERLRSDLPVGDEIESEINGTHIANFKL